MIFTNILNDSLDRIFFICIFLSLFQIHIGSCQEISIITTDPDCESNGKIQAILDAGTLTERFFILNGPVCDSGACPIADNPYGVFQSLQAGTYTLAAFSFEGNFIASVEVELLGDYVEPVPMATAAPAFCGANGMITIEEVIGGRAPYEFRVFPGNVIDYCTAIGPVDSVVPFEDKLIFSGLIPNADLMITPDCIVPNTPNPLPGFWTYQVRDACNVIRSSSIFIDEFLSFKNPVFKLTCAEEDCLSAITEINVSSPLFSNTSFSINKILTDPFYADLKMLLPITVTQVGGADAPRVLDVLDIDNPIGDYYEITHQCDDPIQLSLDYSCGDNDFNNLSTTVVKSCFPPVEFATYVIGCSPDLDSVKYTLSENKLEGTTIFMFCQDELIVTITDTLTNEILFQGSLTDRENLEWIFSVEHELIFEYYNACSNSIDYWEPIIPEPDRNFLFSSDYIVLCEGEFWVDVDVNNGFDEGLEDIVVISAPAGYEFALPHSLGSMGFTQGPPGEYCYEFKSECKVIEECINTPANATFNLDLSIDRECSSQLFVWTLSFPDDMVMAEILIYAYTMNDDLISVKNLSRDNLSASFALDPSMCGQDIRFDIQTFGETCFTQVEAVACYDLPDGAEVIPFVCPNLNCEVETVNVVVTSPLEGGDAPFTFWLFNEGEEISCCTPIQEIISNDPKATFVDICAEEFPLDIFITDNCGQQLFYQVSFGESDLGIILQSKFEICEEDTLDLLSILPDIALSGFITPLGNSPDLVGTNFISNRSLIEQCFEYQFLLPDGTFVGQCGEIVDTFNICVLSCNPLFDAIISGYVWEDLDHDDIINNADIYIANVIVKLYDEDDNLIAETFSDDMGFYSFTMLGRGDYYLEFDLIPGFEFVSPNEGADQTIDSDVDATNGFGTTTFIALDESEHEMNWDAGIRCIPLPQLFGEGPDGNFDCNANPQFQDPQLMYVCAQTSSGNNGLSMAPSQTCGLASVVFTDNFLSDLCFGRSIERVWIATDLCGNTSSITQILSPVDNVPPVIYGVQEDGSYICTENPIFSEPDISDNCSMVNLEFEDFTLPGLCGGDDITRVWTATDACGNVSTASQTFISLDNEAPIILGVGGAKYFDCDALPEFDVATASDNCSEVSLSYQDLSLTGSCAGDILKRVWTAIDACGNIAVKEQTLTPSDHIPPVIEGIGSDGVYPCELLPVFSDPAALDNCLAVSLEFVDVVGNLGCLGISITRTWSASDACGNISTASQTMTAEDVTPPVFTSMIEDADFDCGDPSAFDTPSYSDNCSNVTLSFEDEFDASGCAGVKVSRLWILTDACGNTNTASQQLNFVDTIPPTISGLGPDMVYNCDSGPDFSSPMASDDCTTASMMFTDEIVGTNCAGDIITRTWIAEDACGNQVSVSQTMIPEDLQGPVFAKTTEEFQVICGDPLPLVQPSISDNCGMAILNFTDATSSSSCGGDNISRIWIAIDACGNTSSFEQIYYSVDYEAPSVSVVEADGYYSCGESPAFSTPIFSDNCSQVTVNSFDTQGTLGCYGESVSRIWFASDACGNINTARQTMILEDTIPPFISGVGANRVYTCGEIPGFGDSLFVSEVTFDFEDCYAIALQESSADYSEFTGVVSGDDQAPIITVDRGHLYRVLPHTNRHSCTPGVDGGIAMCVNYNADCEFDSGNHKAVIIELIMEPEAGLENRIQSLDFFERSPLNFTFVDGPSGPANPPMYYAVRVLRDGYEIYREVDIPGSSDWSLERFDFSGDINFSFSEATEFRFELLAYCLIDNGAIKGVWDIDELTITAVSENVNVTAEDNCELVDFWYVDEVDAGFCSGATVTRTWFATDLCGNLSSVSQSLIVDTDIEAPVIFGILGDTMHACGAEPIFSEPYALDNCSDVTLEYVDEVFGDNAIRTWTATDECGNFSTLNQTSSEDCAGPRSSSIFPNPSNGLINISHYMNMDGSEDMIINILNTKGQNIGQPIYHYSDGNRLFSEWLQLEDYASGIYLLEFELGDKIYLERIVIVK